MGWEPERNRFSLSPHGIKEAEGHATRGLHDANCVTGPEMPPGILGPPLNPDPHRAGPRSNVTTPESSRPSRGAPQQMRPPHTASPHRYAPETERQSVIVTPRSRP
jgi:hypothetical protein